ncbi:MAG TPA: hypothetical protein VFB45_10540 [Pseudolabrys sp.]|nr:hypothetical protein [Pseudolabrys sp.]
MNNGTRDFVSCRAEAERCGEQARRTKDLFARKTFLDLQQHWLRLAERYIASERADIAFHMDNFRR